jgi:nucleoside-diphosphate-sugar epimerase
MKRVAISGAAGHAGKYITRKMRALEDADVFGISPEDKEH